MAIWSFLAKEWNITVSDEEVHTFLDEYYKNTNNSIREYKQDKEKFNKIKNDIELRKVIDAINNKFTVKLNLNLTAPKEI
jgi:FKBP-type peptidyl-prolyl cis-trans isomerase (trigger factor)